MAIAFVRSSRTNVDSAFATTVAVTLGGSVAVGDLIVGKVGWGDQGLTEVPTSVADNLGNSYTIITGTKTRDTSNNQSNVMFYCISGFSGTPTVTATFPTTPFERQYRDIEIGQFTGADSVPLDVSVAAFQSSATAISTGATAALAGTGEVAVSFCQDTSAGAVTITKKATATAMSNTGGTDGCASQYEILASASAYTATFTFSAARSALSAVAVFKAAGGGTTPVTGSDTATGTEGKPDIALSGPKEAGSGADAGSCSATVTPIRETGTGTETQSLAVVQSGSDTGSGTETAAVVVTQTGADTGTFDDSLTEIAIGTGGESGTGSDTGSVSATTGPGESGSGAENGTISASLTASESGTGVESASVVQTGTSPSDSDSGTGSDAAIIDALLASLDTGTGVESASLVVTVISAETGAGADTGFLTSVSWWASESGSGAESASVSGPATYTGLALGKPYIVPRIGGEYP